MPGSGWRRLVAIAVGLVVAIVAFVVVLFANFRTNSNYRFQSVADFFYQTLTSRKLTYDFVDQNISEVEGRPARFADEVCGDRWRDPADSGG